MQDDFDNGMGMPDDELTGGATLSEVGDAPGGPEELQLDLDEPAGRSSGGTRSAAGAWRPKKKAAAMKKPAKKSAGKAKKSAKKAGKKKKAGKAKARKGSKKRRGKKK